MLARFPRRRADGSFGVAVSLAATTAEPDVLASKLSAWVAEWIAANETWDFLGQRLHFDDEFVRDTVRVECQQQTLVLLVEGKPKAKWWKDWLVARLLKEMKEAFPEVHDVTSIADPE